MSQSLTRRDARLIVTFLAFFALCLGLGLLTASLLWDRHPVWPITVGIAGLALLALLGRHLIRLEPSRTQYFAAVAIALWLAGGFDLWWR
jgi:hypothetical protein